MAAFSDLGAAVALVIVGVLYDLKNQANLVAEEQVPTTECVPCSPCPEETCPDSIPSFGWGALAGAGGTVLTGATAYRLREGLVQPGRRVRPRRLQARAINANEL